jgi:hypothetical protein
MQQIADVEVHVVVGRPVHVDMDEGRVVAGVVEDQARLLLALPQRSSRGAFTGLEVAAGLQPPVEPAVEVEQHAPRPDHDGRRRHMGQVGVPVERARHRGQGLEDGETRPLLTRVGRLMGGQGALQLRHCRVG